MKAQGLSLLVLGLILGSLTVSARSNTSLFKMFADKSDSKSQKKLQALCNGIRINNYMENGRLNSPQLEYDASFCVNGESIVKGIKGLFVEREEHIARVNKASCEGVSARTANIEDMQDISNKVLKVSDYGSKRLQMFNDEDDSYNAKGADLIPDEAFPVLNSTIYLGPTQLSGFAVDGGNAVMTQLHGICTLKDGEGAFIKTDYKIISNKAPQTFNYGGLSLNVEESYLYETNIDPCSKDFSQRACPHLETKNKKGEKVWLVKGKCPSEEDYRYKNHAVQNAIVKVNGNTDRLRVQSLKIAEDLNFDLLRSNGNEGKSYRKQVIDNLVVTGTQKKETFLSLQASKLSDGTIDKLETFPHPENQYYRSHVTEDEFGEEIDLAKQMGISPQSPYFDNRPVRDGLMAITGNFSQGDSGGPVASCNKEGCVAFGSHAAGRGCNVAGTIKAREFCINNYAAITDSTLRLYRANAITGNEGLASVVRNGEQLAYQ